MDINSFLKNTSQKKLANELKNFEGLLSAEDFKKVSHMIKNINDPEVKKQLESIDQDKFNENIKKNPKLFNKINKLKDDCK